ncbi:ArsR/SmtB family transcription factor [Propionibacterium sp.]|uniref:ArsR/SmtB family transcription factor n=1 Tax=Propionibacterium sp. TaxID=1977903 RepID=UPI0039EA60C3
MDASRQVDLDSASAGVTLDSEYIELAAEVFSLLSDPTRIRLVVALINSEHSVGELATMVGKQGPAVSQHLAKLRWAHIVIPRQEGNRVYYRLVDEHAVALITQAVYQAEHVVEFLPRHHLEAGGADDPLPGGGR